MASVSGPHHPSTDAMEALLVNNADLEKISAFLNRFNPIRVMRMEHMEIRHSAILSWLLDPRETHGLGDGFLRAFLAAALRGMSDGPLGALDIIQADLGDAEVFREKQSMDLFVLSPRNGWSFVIENKFHSSQGDGQLERYRKRAEKDAQASGIKMLNQGIFLTLHEEEPQDAGWATLRYSEICETLSALLELSSDSLSGEVRQFLEHYLDIIKEAAGMSDTRSEMEKLAKRLYRQHRKVIDFLVEHGSGTDFVLAVESVFGDEVSYHDEVNIDGQNLMFAYQSNTQVSFLPVPWRDALGGQGRKEQWAGCEKWWDGYPIICWFELQADKQSEKGKLVLYAEVGPLSDHNTRTQLLEKIDQAKSERVGFWQGGWREGVRYTKFLRQNSKLLDDVSESELIAEAMRSLLSEFEQPFAEVGEALKDFTKYVDDRAE